MSSLPNQAIITSCSTKFFPSLLNLLGSLHANYPGHPPVFVYDLGLLSVFRKELERIAWVRVLDMARFSPFWRSCYTWKTYILAHPLARLNLYLDAGAQVLRPLDELFELTERDGFAAVEQDSNLGDITPAEYKSFFPIEPKFFDQHCVTAGIVGFKKDSQASVMFDALYAAGRAGLALGFSAKEQFRNKGVNRTQFVRDCVLFRHDTTLFSLLVRQYFPAYRILAVQKYAGYLTPNDHPEQLIWNFRLNYSHLDYLDAAYLHPSPPFLSSVNRVIVAGMLVIKRILKFIKQGK